MEIESKYKVGDIVTLKTIEEIGGCSYLAETMKAYLGKTAVIEEIIGTNYKLDVDNGVFLWYDWYIKCICDDTDLFIVPGEDEEGEDDEDNYKDYSDDDYNGEDDCVFSCEYPLIRAEEARNVSNEKQMMLIAKKIETAIENGERQTKFKEITPENKKKIVDKGYRVWEDNIFW